MAGLLVNDVIQITLKYTLFDQICMNTFHYKVTTANPTAPSVAQDLIDIAGEVDTNANSIYNKARVALPVNVANDFISVQRIHNARSVRYDKVPSNVVNARGNASTANLSAVITRGTDIGERGQVGSIHLPGVADADVAAGELVAGLLTATSALGSAMLSAIVVPAGGVQLSPVLYHPDIKNSEGIIIRGWFINDLTRTIPQKTARVMRRRTLGVGQ